MQTDACLAILIAAGTTLPLGWAASRGSSARMRRALLGGWLVAIAGFSSWVLAGPGAEERAVPTDRPIQVAHEGYVGSSSCQACHPGEYATWHRSYHRTMTQSADVRSVLGPIDGMVVMARGRPFKLERRGDEVWVELDDPDWSGTSGSAPRVARQIVQTTGSHTEQFYWISSGRGRNLRILPIMYRLLGERRWASLDGCCITEPAFVQDLADGRWNNVCNRCHSTHALPGITDESTAADTRVAELGIACEACHGPGGPHAERYRDPRARYELHDSGAPAQAIVNPRHLSKERSAEVCGQCHAVTGFAGETQRRDWRQKGFSYRPGSVLADERELASSGEDRFWSDGMIRVSGREHNGLVRSPCYLRGEMQCLSCHSLHRLDEGDQRDLGEWADDLLRPGMQGDRACTQCHKQFDEAGARAAHTHHAAGSSGDACMNCHMPYSVYGLLKTIRSHQVSSPSVQESLDPGRPNACNLCHLDRTLQWTGENLERWYGIAPPALGADQQRIAASVLWILSGDAGQRVINACAFESESARAASGTDWMVPYLVVLLQDSYQAVRSIAQRTLLKHPEGQRLKGSDPLEPPDRQQRWVRPILEHWGRGKRGASPALLVDAKGEITLEEFMRILHLRDESNVVLNE